MFFLRLRGNLVKNQVLAFDPDELNKMNFICRLKAFFYQQYTTGHLCYWLLNSGNGDMVKANQPSLYFRFFKCHPRTHSVSTSFALLKLRSKARTKKNHFCMSPE